MVVSLIILAICIPLTGVITGYFTLKAVQMGLRWQVEIKKEQKPTMEKQDINPFERQAPAPQQSNEIDANNILYEWINGAKEEVKP